MFHTGRLWCLKFHATSDKQTSALGSWAISLSIINPSPPTWLDSRVVILGPSRKSSAFLPPWPLPKGSAVGSLMSASSQDVRRDNPPIQFLLKTKHYQLQPSAPSKTRVGRSEVITYFAENTASSGLQYPYECLLSDPHSFLIHVIALLSSDSAYYSSDGSLQVIMEAQLAKPAPEEGCIIC